MSPLTALLIAASFGGPAATDDDRPLNIGDAAPAFKVAKWIKGKPVESLKSGKVYVIEFWATWCGPCKRVIPHITELAVKYRGKATFIGVSVFEGKDEKEDEQLAKVTKFVDSMGDRMGYAVAADGTANFMSKQWLQAAGENGIPATFIVGDDGKIAWIGHPSELEETLGQVLDGTYDGKALARKRLKEKLEEYRESKLLARITEPMEAGKPMEALAELEKAVAENPKYKSKLAFLHFRLLLQTDETKAYVLARQLGEGEYRNQAQALFQLARLILETPTLKTPDYSVAIGLAQRANELTRDKHPLVIGTLAQAYFKNGEPAKAIEFMERAIGLARKVPMFPEELEKIFKDRLAEYKRPKPASP